MASEQITYADEQAELPNALEDSEIARIMKLVSKSKYKKSEDAPTRQKQEFKPRSLVEIAMEAQKKPSNEDSESKIELEQKENVDEGKENEQSNIDKDVSSEIDEQQLEAVENISSQAEIKENQNEIGPATEQQSSDIAQKNNNISTNQQGTEDSEISETAAEIGNKVEKNQDINSNQFKTETETKKTENSDLSDTQYDKGFIEGFEAGKNEIKKELDEKFDEKINTLESLIVSLTGISSAETKKLEADIQNAILSLSSERAGISIAEMPEKFLTRIETLMSRLGDSINNPTIELNKTDLVHIETVKEKSEKLSRFHFIGKDTLNAGDIVISLGGIEIQDILENRISIPLSSIDEASELINEQSTIEETGNTTSTHSSVIEAETNSGSDDSEVLSEQDKNTSPSSKLGDVQTENDTKIQKDGENETEPNAENTPEEEQDTS